MSKVGLPKEAFLPPVVPAAGLYLLALKGFSPKKSSSGDSVNLSPWLRVKKLVSGDPLPEGVENVAIFDNLNYGEKTGRIIDAFHHAAGVEQEVDPDTGSKYFLGEFVGWDAAMNDANLWKNVKYQGPLTDLLFKAELALVPKQIENPLYKAGDHKVAQWINDTDAAGKTLMQAKVKQWLCQVPGCIEKHPDNLAR